MLNVKIFYIFLFLIVVETTGLLLLKNGLERGYLDTGAIILACFSLLSQPMFIRLGLLYNKKP